MSRTLNFAEHLMELGRNLQQRGQSQAASRLLSRLSSFSDLPQDVAAEAHLRLAELYLQGDQLHRARRELTAALVLQPDNAHYHFLMAGAVEDEEGCDRRRALMHYRRCCKLDPDNAEYLCALGLFALEQGETAEGLKALRRAGSLAPDNHAILGQVVKGLREAGAMDEARKLLQTALFRNARDQRFRDLWTHHQFQLLHANQQDDERTGQPHKQRGPVLLPFARPAPEDTPLPGGKKRLRHDLPSGTPGPKLPVRRRLSGKKK